MQKISNTIVNYCGARNILVTGLANEKPKSTPLENLVKQESVSEAITASAATYHISKSQNIHLKLKPV